MARREKRKQVDTAIGVQSSLTDELKMFAANFDEGMKLIPEGRGFTAEDVAIAIERTDITARRHLLAQRRAGTIKLIGRRALKNMYGKRYYTSVYENVKK